jgi:beta-lactam-binding protein with PASTA domain
MIFSFITKKPLWQNILAGFMLSLFIVGAFLLLLNFITNHGEYLTVPEVKGKVYSAVVADLESKGFEVVVQDSIYVDSLAPNIILKQFPDPEATVKVNRIITLPSTAPFPQP